MRYQGKAYLSWRSMQIKQTTMLHETSYVMHDKANSPEDCECERRKLGLRAGWGGGGGGGGGGGRRPATPLNFSPPLRIRSQIAPVPPSRHSSLKLTNSPLLNKRHLALNEAPSAPHYLLCTCQQTAHCSLQYSGHPATCAAATECSASTTFRGIVPWDNSRHLCFELKVIGLTHLLLLCINLYYMCTIVACIFELHCWV